MLLQAQPRVPDQVIDSEEGEDLLSLLHDWLLCEVLPWLQLLLVSSVKELAGQVPALGVLLPKELLEKIEL